MVNEFKDNNKNLIALLKNILLIKNIIHNCNFEVNKIFYLMSIKFKIKDVSSNNCMLLKNNLNN